MPSAIRMFRSFTTIVQPREGTARHTPHCLPKNNGAQSAPQKMKPSNGLKALLHAPLPTLLPLQTSLHTRQNLFGFLLLGGGTLAGNFIENLFGTLTIANFYVGFGEFQFGRNRAATITTASSGHIQIET